MSAPDPPDLLQALADSFKAVHPARRPDAERETITFGDLEPGDYITAELYPAARWVLVKRIQLVATGLLHITFETPTIEGSGHTRWCIDRDPDDTVVIDAAARRERA